MVYAGLTIKGRRAFRQRAAKTTKDNVIRAVLLAYNTDIETITNPSRKQERVWARHTLSYLLYNRTSLTLKMIGKLVNRHHATVLNSLTQYEELNLYDKEFQKMVKRVIRNIEET